MAFQMSSLAMSSIMSLKIPVLASESVLQSSHHQRTKQLPCKVIEILDKQKKTRRVPGEKKKKNYKPGSRLQLSPALQLNS